MSGVTTVELPPIGEAAPRTRFDRPVLVGNLVSGALWLLLLAVLGSWPLALIGAAYVAVASVFLARVYGGERLSRKQEALAWATPWLGAVVLWTLVIASIEDGVASSGWLNLWPGLVLGTLCYLAWQLSALAVRQFLTWRHVRA